MIAHSTLAHTKYQGGYMAQDDSSTVSLALIERKSLVYNLLSVDGFHRKEKTDGTTLSGSIG